MIDSIDAATEGVGEQDSARPAAALAPILDIAHREAGPAIPLLGNVIKSGAYGRGSGVVEDRADIVYEVRDATDLQPTNGKPWWLELPAAGREAWGERAARRRRRETYRLAFIPSKFRIGEEPEPFILEVDLRGECWTVRDVTADVEAAGHAAAEAAAAEKQAHLAAVVAELTAEIGKAVDAGEPWSHTEAEAFLKDRGVKRKLARGLLAEHEGQLWRSEKDNSSRGRPLRLFRAKTADPLGRIDAAAQNTWRETPANGEVCFTPPAPMAHGVKTTSPVAAPDAAIASPPFAPPSAIVHTARGDGENRRRTEPGVGTEVPATRPVRAETDPAPDTARDEVEL